MNYTVLIVDDAIENIQIMRKTLEEEYDLKIATSGKDAVKIANKFRPDIILLDILMPDMDGYEVTAKLKENPYTSNIPIIFVTVKGSIADEVKGFEIGAVDYIIKPISPAIVKARVKNHLALSNRKASLEFEVKDQTKELNQSCIDLIQRLAVAAEYKEINTAQHMSRVANYSVLIARKCGFGNQEIEILSLAAPLHDVGKIGIPDEIINKPGKYTEEEFEIMKRHAEIGENILGKSNNKFLHAACIICAQHHERYDGSGYPRNLKADEIHPYAKICAIADVFDALTTERTYKKAWSFDEAYEYIVDQGGKHFDPQMVNCFKESYKELKEIYTKIR